MTRASTHVREGHALARRATRLGSRSFYLASFLLDGERRAAAYALYAFLRAADDAADDPGAPSARAARVARRREALERAYAGAPREPLEHALAWAVGRYGIPRRPIEQLLDAVLGDVGRVRMPTWEALDRYCYGVASTVGLAMAPLLGAPDSALDAAASLGRAMQLTNVLRDVREDYAQDRVYLPADLMARAGVAEQDLARDAPTDAFRAVAALIGSKARAAYDEAEAGIEAIGPRRSRATVRLMRAVYREILVEIERRGYDVMRERVVIPTRRKLWLAAQVLAGADPARPPEVVSVEGDAGARSWGR